MKKPDPRFHILSELFPFAPTRAQRTVFNIVEGAIKSYGTHGIEGATYDRIAKSAKVSRALVQHYFKDRENLFELAVKVIRLRFQELVVKAMSEHTSPEKQLKAYLESNLTWAETLPLHTHVWILFYFNCAIEKKWKLLNTELSKIGQQRLEALIRAGNQTGAFKCKKPAEAAKQIQILLTGALIVYGTEELPQGAQAYWRTVVADCLEIVA